MEGFAECKHI